MAITPPTNYDTTFLQGFLGTEVTAGDVRPVAANHNLVYANYSATLAHALWTRGGSLSSAGWADMAAWHVPADPDLRDVTVVVQCRHSGSGVDGNLRATLEGATSATVTVPTGTSGYTDFTLTVTPGSASANELVLECDSAEVTIACVTAYRALLSGSLTDTPKASGFSWFQTSNVDTTEPLTDEQLNRLIRGPSNLWVAQRTPMFSAAECLVAGAQANAWNGPDTDPVFQAPVTVRVAGTYRVAALFVGPHTAQLQVELSPWTTATLSPGAGALPASSPYTWSTQDVELGAGEGTMRVFCAGSGSASNLYGLSIYPVVS